MDMPKIVETLGTAVEELAAENGAPKNRTSPFLGGFSPTRFRNNVLFPQPEPPMMKKIDRQGCWPLR